MQTIIFSDTNGALGFGRYAGAYRIATAIRAAGFTCQVVDFFAEMTMDELNAILDKYVTEDTLWVGFSTTLFATDINCSMIKDRILDGTYNNSFMIENWKAGTWPRPMPEMYEMVKRVKANNPETKIVVGGTKALRKSTDMDIDYYVWGEADTSIVALCKHLRDGDDLKYDEFAGARRVIGEDYDVGPMYDKTIEWAENDHVFPQEVLPIELSRGCIFRCSYCSFKNLGKKTDDTYLKSIDTFRDEVTSNYERFGTTSYMFSDDTFNDSPAKVAMYAECIRELPFRLSWAGYCRIDTLAIGDKIIHDLKDTNPDFINFGIETFNHKAGRAVGKGMNPQRVKDTLHKVKDILGDTTSISCNFIAGLRHETEDDIWETVEWLTSDDCPVDAFNFTPLYLIHYRRDVMDKTSDFSNDLGNNPEENGYEYDPETGGWKHETMTSVRAHEIVNEIYRRHDTMEKTLANRIGFFGRLQNLGLGLHDLKTISASTAEPVMRLVQSKLDLKTQYVNNLLQWTEQ